MKIMGHAELVFDIPDDSFVGMTEEDIEEFISRCTKDTMIENAVFNWVKLHKVDE